MIALGATEISNTFCWNQGSDTPWVDMKLEKYGRGKEESKDQEYIQSSTTSDTGHHSGKVTKTK